MANLLAAMLNDTSLLAAITADPPVYDRAVETQLLALNNTLVSLMVVLRHINTDLNDFRFELMPASTRRDPGAKPPVTP